VRADLLRAPLAPDAADLVLLADVLEHVSDVPAALGEAARLLREGGRLYVNTINCTRRARWLAVRLAEGVGLVPRGTHDPDLFVSPQQLCAAAKSFHLELERIQGERANIARTIRRWAISLEKSSDLSVGYSALFRKRQGNS
jgi:2-polyprenyl-6-hydroxyphenyl methylase/3-demethylubiquinone-9 3-methyltransferase